MEAAGTLIFPDFELVHRRERERRWLLEIAGFWTPEYLTTNDRTQDAVRRPNHGRIEQAANPLLGLPAESEQESALGDRFQVVTKTSFEHEQTASG